ncbi:MAG TPA: hypothetical protein PLV50_00500 [Smithella sp.]|nr:hypothetical protein [Smithella sp.]HNY50387.1 hypothetical protein [Smithella sp.]HOG88984.1 hypothetical protein [Smithella sp.]HOU50924.1 hypothetical protein [Smithella sp.]HQG66724.1 hypothetical protein [Smithella sp.]
MGMLICTLGCAIARTGVKHISVKKKVLKNNFFIGFPPWVND